MRGRNTNVRCALRHLAEDVLRITPDLLSRWRLAVLTSTILLSFALAGLARAAEEVFEPVLEPPLAGQLDPAPKLLYRTGAAMPRIYGVSHTLAPGWKASYGLGLADETALSSAFLRLDELIDSGELNARGARENWRHFLGLEYTPVAGFDVLGGIAKSSGVNGNGGGFAPSGYERLRLNSGLRWRGDDWGLDGWGVDSSFSFIPNGPTRWPGDAGFLPSMGGTGPTWLFALSVSRRF